MRTPTVSSMATGTPGTVVWAGCAQRSHADPDRCAVLLNLEIFVLKSSASLGCVCGLRSSHISPYVTSGRQLTPLEMTSAACGRNQT